MPREILDFNLSEEQTEFRETLRRFFEEHAPMSLVRDCMGAGGGFSVPTWKSASEELGLAGLAIPESCGGQGFGLKELALALGEVGRGLVPIPLFASAALAGRVVEAVAGADRAWLEPIALGEIATLAWVDDPSGSPAAWAPERTAMAAEPDGDAYRLSGAKHFVLAAPEAARLFVVARAPGSQGSGALGLFAVERDASGVEITPRETLDLTRPLSSIRFDGAEARAVGTPGEAAAGLRRGLDEATALLCAEMVGGMQQVLETAVGYAAERHQFSRPIGSFQAIKHKCADLLIDFEGARTTADAAVVAFDEGDPEAGALASVAKAHVGPAYVRMAIESGQIQGGVGYTWEYDAHLFYRRALAGRELLGSETDHYDRLITGLATEGPAEGGA